MTADLRLNEPRYATLPNIMKVFWIFMPTSSAVSIVFCLWQKDWLAARVQHIECPHEFSVLT